MRSKGTTFLTTVKVQDCNCFLHFSLGECGVPAQALEGISSTREGARDIMRGDILAGRSKDLTYGLPSFPGPTQLSVTCSTKFSELSFAGLSAHHCLLMSHSSALCLESLTMVCKTYFLLPHAWLLVVKSCVTHNVLSKLSLNLPSGVWSEYSQ